MAVERGEGDESKFAIEEPAGPDRRSVILCVSFHHFCFGIRTIRTMYSYNCIGIFLCFDMSFEMQVFIQVNICV